MAGSIHSLRVGLGKPSALALVVLGTLFLVFGLGLVNVGISGNNEPELQILLGLFGIIWVAVCLSMVGYGLYSLFGRKPPVAVTVGIDGPGLGRETPDFDIRLRKLGALRDEGLISPEEYDRKRAEILGERW
jgi:Short C-terminal domain